MSDGDKVLAWIRDWLADGGAVLMIADLPVSVAA